MARCRFSLTRLWRRTEGAAAVEMAVVTMVLTLLFGGIIDLGHAWYLQQVVTNASREGARYGITYKTNSSGQRIPPTSLSPTIQSVIINYLSQAGLGFTPTVTISGAGAGTGTQGADLEVKVTTTKSWFILSGLIPSLGPTKQLMATTVMKCE